MLGRVSTSSAVVNYGAIPAGALLAGLAAGTMGVRAALWIMLAGLLLSSRVLPLGPLPLGPPLLGPLGSRRDLPVPGRA